MSIVKKSTLVSDLFDKEKFSEYINNLDKDVRELVLFTQGRVNGSVVLDSLRLTAKTDATRGSAGTAGRIIFNSDDGNLNIDDGTDWILPDGTTT